MKAGMQNILKAISKITDNADIKSIINSVNSNQNMSKEWLVENMSERLESIVLYIIKIYAHNTKLYVPIIHQR